MTDQEVQDLAEGFSFQYRSGNLQDERKKNERKGLKRGILVVHNLLEMPSEQHDLFWKILDENKVEL